MAIGKKAGRLPTKPCLLFYHQCFFRKKNIFITKCIFSDIFYYISEDGKAAVRKNVLTKILNNLPTLKDNESYSFNIIAHSAGTVIMHDLLFIIFLQRKKTV